MDNAHVETLLVRLGGEIGFPPTPAMAQSVLEGITTASPRRDRARVLRIAAAAAVVVVTVVLVFPGPRRAVANLLGLGGVGIVIAPELPQAPAAADLTGEVTSLEEAQSATAFDLLLPEGFGSPDAVLLDSSVASGLVTLAYQAEEGTYGLVIRQMRGSIDQQFLGKVLGPDTTLISVDVGGDAGLWIEGPAHALSVLDETGAVREDQTRLVGNTLLFVRGGVTVRIESGLGLEAALDIAASLAPHGD